MLTTVFSLKTSPSVSTTHPAPTMHPLDSSTVLPTTHLDSNTLLSPILRAELWLSTWRRERGFYGGHLLLALRFIHAIERLDTNHESAIVNFTMRVRQNV